MENNWEKVVEKIILKSWEDYVNTDEKYAKLPQEEINNWIARLQEYALNPVLIGITLKAMNLVFEATKKECADNVDNCYDTKGRIVQNKESILNIEKPNL